MKVTVTVFPCKSVIVHGLTVNDVISQYNQMMITSVSITEVKWIGTCEGENFTCNAGTGTFVRM
jgi:hypothetical protein